MMLTGVCVLDFSRTRHDAAFVACIHRICFQESALVTADQAANKKTKMEFEMPPVLVGDTSMKSLNFHTGVMLLEKQILKVGLTLSSMAQPLPRR
jgi:hypothetical protein